MTAALRLTFRQNAVAFAAQNDAAKAALNDSFVAAGAAYLLAAKAMERALYLLPNRASTSPIQGASVVLPFVMRRPVAAANH